MQKSKLHSAAQRSRPVDNLLYFMFEFQPIAQHPQVERRGQIHEKVKLRMFYMRETSGSNPLHVKRLGP
jgi:hypothetical protein